ncbi:MAG: energy transducer TonB [Candidatus Krumholzibacteria bacterium]|nr:energy transducer TonB [Candidatus Krumholzibacteria bacterium]
MGRISEHDRTMRKRLLLIFPAVILAHLLALVTLARVDLMHNMITLGYRGPLTLEPEISILDNRTPESRVTSKERRAMVVQNVFIEGEDKPTRVKGKEEPHKEAEKKTEQMIALEVPGDYSFRTYPSHARVPYREDYVILRMVKPEYPFDALANAEEGYVLVEAYIDAGGAVNEAYVRSSYGPRSFETASLTAVKQFLFQPVRENGKPISFWVSFLVRFQLRR